MSELLDFLTNPTFSSDAIASFFTVFVQEKSSKYELIQSKSDYLLAWRLQVEEYKMEIDYFFPNKNAVILPKRNNEIKFLYKEKSSEYIIMPAGSGASGRNCFFEAVNKLQILNRQTLANTLIENAYNSNLRDAFGVEIRQFLYLGNDDNYHDIREHEACQFLLDNSLKELFTKLHMAEDELRIIIDKSRLQLGESETIGKKPNEL
jgi:hypothetical protein